MDRYENDIKNICTSSFYNDKSDLCSWKFAFQYYLLCGWNTVPDYCRVCDLLHCKGIVDFPSSFDWHGNNSVPPALLASLDRCKSRKHEKFLERIHTVISEMYRKSPSGGFSFLKGCDGNSSNKIDCASCKQRKNHGTVPG